MMTCGSDRSGIASSGTLRIAYSDPTMTNAVNRNTSMRCFAHDSMMRPTMAASVPGVAGRGLGSHSGDRGLHAALRIDQERRARHHGVALGESGEHLHVVVAPKAGRHHARFE